MKEPHLQGVQKQADLNPAARSQGRGCPWCGCTGMAAGQEMFFLLCFVVGMLVTQRSPLCGNASSCALAHFSGCLLHSVQK